MLRHFHSNINESFASNKEKKNNLKQRKASHEEKEK